MDQDALVSGGVVGLKQIAQAFRSRGIAVSGVYLIRLTSMDDVSDWIIRLVTDRYYPDLTRKMINELVKLRRDEALPQVSSKVRFDIVAANNNEASRVLDYARRFGKTTINNTMWDGVFIERAIVGEIPALESAPA